MTGGISQVVKTSTLQVFEHILPLTGISVTVSLFLLPAIFFMPLPVALFYLMLVGVPLAGLAVFASRRVLRRERWFGKELRQYAKRLPQLVTLGLLYGVLALILYASWWYHLRQDAGMMRLSFYVALFQTYFVGMFLISQLFTLPLLFGEEPLGLMRCVLRSMQTVFRRPGFALSLFVQLLCAGVLLGFTVIGFFFLFPGICGVMLQTAAKQVEQAAAPQAERA